MSIDLSAHLLKKAPSIKYFKKFISEKVKDSLKKECHDLKFKEEKKSLWVGCKNNYSRGCWFYFGEYSVCATTYAGRNGADSALQDIGVSELVKKYGGEIYNPQSSASHTFNNKTDKWEKIEIEYKE